MVTLTEENAVLSQTNSIPVVPQQQPEIKPKSNFLTILLSILLLISVLIAGFFAYQTQNLVKELNELKTTTLTPTTQSMSTEEPIATDSSNVDPTANWKTYTGKVFSFKYPSNMTLKRQDIQDPSNSKNIGDLVQLSDTKYELQISSNFEGGWGRMVCVTMKDQKVASVESQIMYFTKPIDETMEEPECSNQYKGFVALVGNKTHEHPYPIFVDLQSKNDSVADLELFNQILSTLKITN